MTNEELYKLFCKSYPEVQPIDYRPADPVFVKGIIGITIWTSFGDVILFFPNLDNDLRTILNEMRSEGE